MKRYVKVDSDTRLLKIIIPSHFEGWEFIFLRAAEAEDNT